MGGDHSHRLDHAVDSPVHRIPAQCAIVATIAFVLVVVTTHRERVGAFALYAVLLLAVAALARIPVRLLARGVVVETPFVVFALLLPFISRGERIDVWGVSMSVTGLWGAWNVLAKATLGVTASVLLAATHPVRDLIDGLERLRLPPLIVQIMSFMVRYGDVIAAEATRMHIARRSRAFEARGVRQMPVLAHSAGALFIRSYERGERVHLAMLSRGYDGQMPPVREARAVPAVMWAVALSLPAAALAAHGAVAVWGATP